MKRIIIGLVITIGLVVQAIPVHAIYSPRISGKINTIARHISVSRSTHGTGTLYSIVDQVTSVDESRRQAGTATGTAADAKKAQATVLENVFRELFLNPLDSFFMAFNVILSSGTVISSCLRDDIWTLEELRDLTVQEMLKAYMSFDSVNGDILFEDYKYLRTHIKLLKDKGANTKAVIKFPNKLDDGTIAPTMSVNKYLFGSDDAENMYELLNFSDKGCQEGEFQQAFEQVERSFETLLTLGSSEGIGTANPDFWGNLESMAKARARIRAGQYIRNNQITATIGGTQGGAQNGLLKGGGFNKFVGKMKNEWAFLKRMIGPVTPFFNIDYLASTVEGIGAEGASLSQSLETTGKCQYYSSREGTWSYCSPAQLSDLVTCEKKAKDYESYEDYEKATAEINCEGFRRLGKPVLVEQFLGRQILLEKNYEREVKEARYIYKSYLNLNTVSDNTLEIVDTALLLVNLEIKRANEDIDASAGDTTPTVLAALKAMDQKHCPNTK